MEVVVWYFQIILPLQVRLLHFALPLILAIDIILSEVTCIEYDIKTNNKNATYNATYGLLELYF